MSEPVVLVLRPEGIVIGEGRVLVGLHRAPLSGQRLIEIRRAAQRMYDAAGGPLVGCSAFRLSPEFPLAPGYDSNVRELADTLRVLDRLIVASANVLEFGGVRAAAMRAATRAVVAVARPRGAISTHATLSDAIAWLQPYARSVGAPEDGATYVRLHREADRRLRELDASRGAR